MTVPLPERQPVPARGIAKELAGVLLLIAGVAGALFVGFKIDYLAGIGVLSVLALVVGGGLSFNRNPDRR